MNLFCISIVRMAKKFKNSGNACFLVRLYYSKIPNVCDGLSRVYHKLMPYAAWDGLQAPCKTVQDKWLEG